MRRWVTALACGLALFAVLPASTVSAHTSFVGSTPVDGSVLAEAPSTADLQFSEKVLVSASSVTLLALGAGTTTALSITSAGDGLTLVAVLPKLDRGAYILRFVVVDPEDLHKTVGSISFGVGVAAPPSQGGTQVDGSVASTALRAVSDAALILGAGAVVVVWVVVRRSRRDLGRAPGLIMLCAWLTAAGWVALFLADVFTVGWAHARWGSLLLGSDPGRRALVGIELAAGTWWGAKMLRVTASAKTQEFLIRILALIAAGFVVAAAYGGHAGIGGYFAVGVALRAAHLASLTMWIGAVAATWLLARGNRPMEAMWSAVSRLAAVGLATTGATGLLLSGRVATTVTALLGTSYGRVIVAKGAVLLVLTAMGAMAARRVSRGLAPRLVPLEVLLAGVAIGLAAVLGSAAPAVGQQFLPLPTVAPQVVTADVSDLTVSAQIEPARPGPNLVHLGVFETRKPAPGVVVGVSMRVTSAAGALVAERSGTPTGGVLEWTDVSLASPGVYRVEVDVTRPDAPVPPFVGSWSVDVAPVPRAARVVSTRTWAPIAMALAGVWIVFIALGRLILRRRNQA